MRANAGFTLLELMIAVVVVASLAAVAYPSYQSYAGRGYRAEAHTALHRLANLQEGKIWAFFSIYAQLSRPMRVDC